ncbi:hypothetical protein VZ212_00555 [Metamycoplasma hominis]|uniref:hypothetical protein n=1 Tax=Metamycoplasma hominis TaxID=2098 RepID=UPI00093B4C11|nr:hypothetical protein [Metamycoplasma hominis]OKL24022.1 hypothetical protein BRO51_00825 [Metamycoplasma hominis]QKX38779.1 hypothetical protein HU157_00820 [Metamycoplasma hominis]QKX39867.1 hypothetical protein HU159_00835 [Metamycoplasma hominis]RBI35431.1 hypothetical protein DRW57_00800 [Metamycoplasma hominis]
MTKKHKRILFLSTLALPVALVPATMVSCSKKDIEEIKLDMITIAKNQMLNYLQKFESFFKNDDDPDVRNLEVEFNKIIISLKKMDITPDFNMDQFIQEMTKKFSAVANNFLNLKYNKAKLTSEYYISKVKAQLILEQFKNSGILPEKNEFAKNLEQELSKVSDPTIKTSEEELKNSIRFLDDLNKKYNEILKKQVMISK